MIRHKYLNTIYLLVLSVEQLKVLISSKNEMIIFSSQNTHTYIYVAKVMVNAINTITLHVINQKTMLMVIKKDIRLTYKIHE